MILIAVVLLILALLGMTGLTAKFAPSRDLTVPAMLLASAGGIIHRRARREGRRPPP